MISTPIPNWLGFKNEMKISANLIEVVTCGFVKFIKHYILICRSDAQINFVLIRADEAHESTVVITLTYKYTNKLFHHDERLLVRGLCDWTWTQCGHKCGCGCDYTIKIFSASHWLNAHKQCLRKPQSMYQNENIAINWFDEKNACKSN